MEEANAAAKPDIDSLYSRLPSRQVLQSLNINSLISNQNNTCKSYFATVFEKDGNLIYSWYLDTKHHGQNSARALPEKTKKEVVPSSNDGDINSKIDKNGKADGENHPKNESHEQAHGSEKETEKTEKKTIKDGLHKYKYAYNYNDPNESQEIIKPVKVIKCYKIIKLCLNILNKYSNLTDEVSEVLHENKHNNPSSNFQLIRLNYDHNKELMIIPNDELILCIVINKQ
ncbi:uncharacterized protein ASCRUDRAFT_70594 [Ascoidea rubescens DSM 1968]|uniref:Uncharacterized protein n=1 Tax=Ascoidea rubescens DSM 1968 TaxID=1344418 RepID=A0A1D2VGV9_9ASCO|nr:hypothetical protein ASCRUDRAFT_70594 [Ascoidea rubescens DSM 1968]ODV60717.1 hypothetical protein ASCRUDRAFT_70594 [Ascoidea rubescens DSM 1968]